MRESALPDLVLQESWENEDPADGEPDANGTGSYPGSSVREDMAPNIVGRGIRPRVLVAFEDEYRSYRETIARALTALRPRAEVAITSLDALEVEIKLTAPHLVICSQPGPPSAARTMAWVELPNDPWRPASIRIKGIGSRVPNPTLDDLLAAVDGTEELLRARRPERDRRPGHTGRR